MKRFTGFALVAAAVLVIGLMVSLGFMLPACSSGGGGGGGGTPLVTYGTTTQAAASTSSSMNSMSVMSDQLNAGVNMGLNNIPAGYAAKLAQRYGTGKAGAFDPNLKMMMDKAISLSKSPMIQKAKKKAASLAAARVTSVNDPLPCDSGSGSITGSFNYDGNNVYTSTYTITFNNCGDSSFYTVLNGTLGYSETSSTSVYEGRVNANLTMKQYDATFATLQYQLDLDGSFANIDHITSGTLTANGAYVFTSGATTTTYAFTNLRDDWTYMLDTTVTPNTETWNDVVSGTFSIAIASSGTTNFQFTLGVSLTDKWMDMNDSPTWTSKEWINGTVTVSWVPDLSAYGCLPGSVVFTTLESDPLVINSLNSFTCPVSGTLTVNNATVEFGTSSTTGSGIDVTVNGTTTNYASCIELEMAGGGSCSAPAATQPGQPQPI
jgi:hypothetical protein